MHSVLRRSLPTPRLVLFASFGLTSFINYVFSLAAGWLLAPADFGLLAFAQSLLLVGGLVLETGVPWLLAREVARATPARRGALLLGGLAANFAIAIALVLLIGGLYALGPLQSGLEHPVNLLFVALALPCIALSNVARGAAQGAERFGAVAAIQTLEVVGKTTAGLPLVLLGFGPTGGIAGLLIGSAIAAALGLWVIGPLIGRQEHRRMDLPHLTAALPMFGSLLALALLLNLDLMSVKLFAPQDRALAGYYQAATMLANIPCYLVSSALIPLLFARLARAGNLEATRGIVGSGLKLIILFIVPIELALALAPGAALGLLFPSAYAPAMDLLRFVALSRAALLIVTLLSAAYQATGSANVAARVLLAACASEAVALLLGVPLWGGPGAAGVALAASAGAALALGAAYCRSVTWPRIAANGPWALRYAAALAAGVGAGSFAEQQQMGLLAATVLGFLCYLLALLLVGLFDLSGGIRGVTQPRSAA